MQRVTFAVMAALMAVLNVNSMPDISLSGYLDTDVWTDFTGRFYTNTELDIGLTMQFTDNVSANLYVTANSDVSAVSGGRIPAGTGNPAERWLSVDIDGFDITYESPYGIFSIGDLVYEYGVFDYYFYKRRSMITPASFSRGLRYQLPGEKFTQSLLIGVADEDYSTVDINGVSTFSLGGNTELNAIYGIRGNARRSIKNGFDFFAGSEISSSFGGVDLSLNIGYLSLRGEPRSNVFTLLLEPYYESGNFYTAFSFYRLFDPDSVNDPADPLFGIEDEMFVYLEPGYAFNDVIALGLPLEYHAFSLDTKDDDEIWVVPTLYVYPAEMVEWWIWGQLAMPASGGDRAFGFGTEIIVTF